MDNNQRNTQYNIIKQQIQRDYQTQIYEERENSPNYFLPKRMIEKETLYYLASGNTSKIEELYKDSYEYSFSPKKQDLIDPKTIPLPISKLSDNFVHHALFHHVISIAFFTRVATDSGVPEHIAFAVGDAYIRGTSTVTDASIIGKLTYSALYEFTQLVFHYQHEKCSPITLACCQYIQRHLHSPITLKDLSNAVQRSERYISDLFAKELGMRPIKYIREKKLDYAKMLLVTNNFSIVHIAELLAFPSSSAFINYFKEKYEVTPQQFRKQNLSKLDFNISL